MPERPFGFVQMELLSVDTRLSVPHDLQSHWYRVAAGYACGCSVLDVGAGTGYGMAILSEGGATVVSGIDPLPLADCVLPDRIEAVPDHSWDWTTCIDVIEHVKNDRELMRHLLRVARRGVFLSTPNWNRFQCANEYHCREYTPDELADLLAGLECEWWTCGDDAVASPPRRCASPSAATANFGVAILLSPPLVQPCGR